MRELGPPADPMRGDGQLDENGKVLVSHAGEHVVARESFRYLEHAPIGIVVVHGGSHSIVYANSSFRQSSGLHDDAIVGRPIVEVLRNPSADGLQNPPATEVVALLDRVRSQPALARDIDLRVSVDLKASAPIGDEDGAEGIWRCMVWPVRASVAGIDELVVELWHAGAGESSLVQQREIAERMLLSALREQALSDDNVRLYGVANEARGVAEEAQLQAESAQHEAERANTAKSEFLAVMSHELRTPLNAIGGYAELMEMGLRGPVTPEQRSDLERIQRSQRYLLGLINGVLNYAKVEGGVVNYNLGDVTLDDVLATCEALVVPRARAKRLTLSIDTSNPALAARADREKLQQIMLNLLDNAVKFTAPDGSVTLTYERDGRDFIQMCVTDTGRGIGADHIERIFAPFVQVDSGLTRTQEGTGLGLAISRDLARGMGGDLTAESELGVGSTFTLRIPAASTNL